MAINNANVVIGAPDQSKTTGAVQWTAVGTALPTDARTVLDWTSGGYVSTDGVSLSLDQSTTAIQDWSLGHIRELLEDFTGTVTFAFVQTDYETLKMLFGEDNVTLTAADREHGAIIHVSMGAELASPQMFAFNMKDGDQRIRLVLPNAQPKLGGELTFVANAPISWSVSLDCGVGEDGKCIHFIYDDGQVTA